MKEEEEARGEVGDSEMRDLSEQANVEDGLQEEASGAQEEEDEECDQDAWDEACYGDEDEFVEEV